MKKIITVLAALAVTTAAAFAGPAISVGGGFGGCITQEDDAKGRIQASPVFSIKGDFQWEKFGVAADFDFNLTKNSPWLDGNKNMEELYANPYVNFTLGDFNFNVGPLVGMRFVQEKNPSTTVNNASATFLFFGGSVNCNYKITEKLNAYLEVPVIANNMLLSSKADSVSDPNTPFYYEAALEVIPKFGLTYTF